MTPRVTKAPESALHDVDLIFPFCQTIRNEILFRWHIGTQLHKVAFLTEKLI